MTDYFVISDNKETKITLNSGSELTAGDVHYDYELKEINCNNFQLKLGDKTYNVMISEEQDERPLIFINGHYFELDVKTGLEKKAAEIIQKSGKAGPSTAVKSPMPGMVLKVVKEEGDDIEIGDTVMILEAMKMENNIKATFSGKLKKIMVDENSPVDKGTELFVIE